MPVRVELIGEAIEDLARYAESDVLPRLLAKLIRLEEVGKDAGQPLGRALTGWRKIVVGDRNWRIIFTTNADDSVATVISHGEARRYPHHSPEDYGRLGARASRPLGVPGDHIFQVRPVLSGAGHDEARAYRMRGPRR